MPEQYCPECGGKLLYENPVRRFVCKGCGLYVTRDELTDLREKAKVGTRDEQRSKKKQQGEYLEWWLSSKK